MTRRRPEAFSLEAAVRSASFTPRRADVGAVCDLVASDDPKLVRAAMRALSRVPEAALDEAQKRLETARPPLRGRLALLVGRLAKGGDDPVGAIAPLLADADPKTRRGAVIALGKVRSPASERALLAYLPTEAAAAHRDLVVEALGKVGGAAALSALDASGVGASDRARITLERSLGRGAASRIDPSGAIADAPIVLACRSGIEGILARELPPALRARASSPGRVDAMLRGSLDEILRARTWTRVGFRLPHAAGSPADAIVRALASPQAERIFATFTKGPVRFRLSFADGARRRAITWAVAEGMRRAKPSIVNDPTGSAWDAIAVLADGGAQVELAPRIGDGRFTYRARDVPAASHPTLAAALVKVAGVLPDAVVWDPFCGSGVELCERAIAGPSKALHGTDTDPDAIEIARQHLAAAGAKHTTLVVADALRHAVEGVTLVLTNPPYGARSEFGRARDLLVRFVDHAAEALAAGGRFVWISPIPEVTLARAARAGLEPTLRQPLDSGLEIQAFWKRR